MKTFAGENLTKTFPRRGLERAVDDVSLRVEAGQTLALVGESGSGKTTLARMMARLVPPTSGRVVFNGTDVWRLSGPALSGFRRRVQMVFQDPGAALDPRQTVFSAVEEPLRLHGLGDRHRRRRRVFELLEMVGLGSAEAGRLPHQLSGGQKQRVTLARALSLGPRLLILDEPVSALDVSVRAQVLNLLERLGRDLGLTYLLISHDLGVVEGLADRVVVMHRGRAVEEGPVSDVWSAPAHPYTRALLAAALVPDPATRPRAPGRPPRELDKAPAGRRATSCLYESICPWAGPGCRRRRPTLRTVGRGGSHLAACHLACQATLFPPRVDPQEKPS